MVMGVRWHSDTHAKDWAGVFACNTCLPVFQHDFRNMDRETGNSKFLDE